MFGTKVKLNQETTDIRKIFGLNEVRTGTIVSYLYASASIKPRYAVMAESLLNEPQFTVKDKAFGMMMIGKLEGVISTLKSTGLRIKFDEIRGPRVAQNEPFFKLVKMFLEKRESPNLIHKPS